MPSFTVFFSTATVAGAIEIAVGGPEAAAEGATEDTSETTALGTAGEASAADGPACNAGFAFNASNAGFASKGAFV